MIIETNFVFQGFDAFTCWPFIFVRPESRDDPGLIDHEMVHYREQRMCLTLPWILLYFVFKRFRLNAELRAYKKQISVGGITISRAAKLLEQYKLGINAAEAEKLLLT